ncbi:MAG: aminoacyl-tRNA hydrolase [Sedimentisphaerales bacterium]|nr:aminoacyl-tRNA hydrolase [Sedimentisphaerales bacterium]
MLKVTETLIIPRQYIHISYVRSQGPGGQNVNKVSTRAQLQFDLENCEQLSPGVKKRLRPILGRRLTKSGHVIIQSDRFRDQIRNRQECLDRLARLIRQALIPPKKRIATKPTRAANLKRMEDKKHRGVTKKYRRRPDMEE